ncbi:MAG: hypothetical protein GXP57_03120 [Deltaproteobacteria bacterium]|nr:hypothetical protein [Deltaproteobacteria bacterium]
MKLADALQNKKEQILSLWVDRTLDSYLEPGFFKKSKDKFANPVGVNIREGLTKLYELLLSKAEQAQYAEPLDQVIRIRAVQDFTPAQAVSPILELKWVVKQVLSADKDTRPLLAELDSFDCDVDRAALAAFDIYMNCREQLHKARIFELKSGNFILSDAGCPSALIRKNQQDKSQIH